MAVARAVLGHVAGGVEDEALDLVHAATIDFGGGGEGESTSAGTE